MSVVRRLAAGFLLMSCLLAPRSAQAGLDDFIGICMAEVADLHRLPSKLAALGWVEMDAADMRAGPMIAQVPGAQRIWQPPGTGAGPALALTGYTPAGSGRPVEVCWHVSKRDDTAAVTRAELKRRFPPLDGTVSTGTAVFYSAFERWQVQAGPETVLVGLEWAFPNNPERSVALYYVAKMLPQDAAGGGDQAKH